MNFGSVATPELILDAGSVRHHLEKSQLVLVTVALLESLSNGKGTSKANHRDSVLADG
jgi:hypothetical protein